MRGLKKRYERVENTILNKLSKEQQEIIYYLTQEFKTPLQIANIRRTSDKAVYKTISKLKKKGILKGVEKHSIIGGVGNSIKPISNEKEYRLHALSFKINIINSSERYLNILKIRNKDELDQNTLMLYDDFIIIYLNKDFYSNIPNICYNKAMDYVMRFIVMLENNYKIILKKGKQYNLKQFRGEIAKTNDIYAKKCNINKEKVKIYDDEGVLRLLVDNSFNLNELEAVSKDNHLNDINKIHKHKDLLKELILNDNLLNPIELQEKIQEIIKIQEHTTVQILKLTELLNSKSN